MRFRYRLLFLTDRINDVLYVLYIFDTLSHYYFHTFLNISKQMHVSFEHFFPRLNQIVTEEYVPNVEDMLLARVRTTGIIIEEFFMHGRKFNIVDVGGQRNERRKWMHWYKHVYVYSLFLLLLFQMLHNTT